MQTNPDHAEAFWPYDLSQYLRDLTDMLDAAIAAGRTKDAEAFAQAIVQASAAPRCQAIRRNPITREGE